MNNKYIDEGYIKFDIEWVQHQAPIHPNLSDIINCRNRLFEKKLIGFYHDFQVGYGNVSIRNGKEFIISGTQTGHIEKLTENEFTLVDAYDISKNYIHCKGPVKASSESITHAAIYLQQNNIECVLHIHDKKMWENILHKVPTTKKEVPYGTPEMALEIERLFSETDVKNQKIIVMEGHDEGIISFGKTIDEAEKVLNNFYFMYHQ